MSGACATPTLLLGLEAAGEARTVEVRREGTAYAIRDGERLLKVEARPAGEGRWSLLLGERSWTAEVRRDSTTWEVRIGGRTFSFGIGDPARLLLAKGRGQARGIGRLVAPMPGRVVKLLVEVGRQVTHGEGIVVIEAMKMQNELVAPRDGVVRELPVGEGTPVEGGALLAVIE